MKLKFPTIFLTLALVGCDQVERADQAQTPPSEEPAPSPAPTPTPAPVAVAPTPTPAPVPRLAPEGVYYVTQRVDITTDSGVIGVKAGTQVKLVRKDNTTMVVSDGKQEFPVQSQVLTNDLDVVGRIATEAAAAAATARAAASSPASTAASAAAATNAELNKAQAAANELQSRRQILQGEETRILGQIEAANAAQTRYAIAKSKGAPIQLEAIVGQLPTLRSRLQKVRDDIRSLK
jgi:hypothetical protein